MTEAQLRDAIARQVDVLEPGLILLSKEQYIPNAIGTRSFIDLYGRDPHGHHVLIELKRSAAASREAIHEVYKYAESVKRHLGVRDEEIRIIVASTDWKELLVPFSRFVAETHLAVLGLELIVDWESNAITSRQISTLPVSQGRLLAPWHEVFWYANRTELDAGIESIHGSCSAKGIRDYVVLTLRPPHPVQSEHQVAMRKVILEVAELSGLGSSGSSPAAPAYEFAAYFAMQILNSDEYLARLEEDEATHEEAVEATNDLELYDALQSLHSYLTALEPRPVAGHFEIGYGAKLGKYLDAEGFAIEEVIRQGVLARNALLEDDAIVAELRGLDGGTGQRLKRTVLMSNRAHVEALKYDLRKCLEENPVWTSQALRAVDEIERDHPTATIDVGVFNPGTGVLTLYLAAIRDDWPLYAPTYHLIVRDPEPVAMYMGTLESVERPVPLRQVLDEYYDGEVGNLVMAMSWGGREARDADVVEDLGMGYRTYRVDARGDERTFYRLRDDRWRSCEPTDPIALFGEYMQLNEAFLKELVLKIAPRDQGGTFDGTNAIAALDRLAAASNGKSSGVHFVGASESCDICGCSLALEKYMIDGRIKDGSAWGCICGECFHSYGVAIRWGEGQLYIREKDEWLLVAGSSTEALEDDVGGVDS